MKRDIYFDGLADRIRKNVYSGVKGQLRLRLVDEDLNKVLPTASSLRILDAGGGLGQMTTTLAKAGHRLTFCEPSTEMMQQASATFEQEGVQDLVTLINQPVQQLDFTHTGLFDLILFHAVLEWLAEPRLTLHKLLEALRPGGSISLMFFNVHSIIIKNLLRGNFRKVRSRDYGGKGDALTPINPLDPAEVLNWLKDWGYEITSHTGIRCFYDYLPRDLAAKRSFEDIYELERELSHKAPYRDMARYIHVIARKPD
jgi:S-adenosylmethionine-dependent methyltransferase